MGDVLFEVNVDVTGTPDGRFKCPDSFDDEVRFTRWQGGVVAGEGKCLRRSEGQPVRQTWQPHHQGPQFVVSVRAFPEDLQGKIQLGRGLENERGHGRGSRTMSAIIRPVMPFSIR